MPQEKLTPEKAEMLRSVCKDSLRFLCTQFLGYKDWDLVHEDLEKFLRRPSKKKAILLPRGHLKSTFVTIAKSIQWILQNPNVRILVANQVWDMSRTFLREIKEQLERSPIKLIFGDFVSAKWNEDLIIVRQRTKPLKEATITTTGVEAETTGGHFDKIILDDLTGLQNSQTPDQRDKTKRFRRSMINLLEPGGELYEIGTRWHLDDTFSVLFEKEIKYYDVMIRKVVEQGKVIFPKHFAKRFDPIRKDWQLAQDATCMDYIEHLKESMPLDEFSCTPGETPILMADWKTKPIEHVQVGDDIVGFSLGQGRKNGGLVKAKVKRTFSKQDHVLKLMMKSGRVVLCTKDHKWYTGRPNDPTHPVYMPAKTGTKLQFVCPVEELPLSTQERMDWNYLSGLFDGEGSTKSGGCLTLAQSQSINPGVHGQMLSVLDRLGIKYGMHVREGGYRDGRNNSDGLTSVWLRDSFRVGLNLIRNTPCGKASQLAERFFKFGKKFIREEDEVVDVKYESYRTVYALETETGNYIAWGFASSNSQYMNDPISSETQLFKPEMFKYWSQRPDGLYLAMSVDLAISQDRQSDRTAIVVCGMDHEWKLYVLDYLIGRWKPGELVDKVFEMQSRWKPHTAAMEVNGFQQMLRSACEDEMRKRRQYFPIDEIRTGPEKTKATRIKSLEPFYRNGVVYHAAWMRGKDLENELQTFDKGVHDDIIDAMSMCLPRLHPGTGPNQPGIPEGSWESVANQARMANRPFQGFFNYGY